jgi:hypothetical protein
MVTMSEDQEFSAEVGRYMVFAAYGELMLEFQSLEVTLYQFLVRRVKKKATLDQWDRKIEGWYGTTLGRLYGSVKARGHLTRSLAQELDGAVEMRNYLAHHFLIEWAIVVPSIEARDAALEYLAMVSNRLAALEEALADHLRIQGIDVEAELDGLDEETRREFEALRPTRWPLGALGADHQS